MNFTLITNFTVVILISLAAPGYVDGWRRGGNGNGYGNGGNGYGYGNGDGYGDDDPSIQVIGPNGNGGNGNGYRNGGNGNGYRNGGNGYRNSDNSYGNGYRNGGIGIGNGYRNGDNRIGYDSDSRLLSDLDYQKANANRRLDLINREQNDISDRKKRLDDDTIYRLNSPSHSGEISGLNKKLFDLDMDKKDTQNKLDKIESEKQFLLKQSKQKKQDELDRLNRELGSTGPTKDVYTI